jgi:pseudouridylate synthase
MQSAGGDRLPYGVVVSDEVASALQRGDPVVALESAVVTHGLPEPANLAAVDSMERAVRDSGAVPAICLARGGQLFVGATPEAVSAVARDPRREKASVRDLGEVLSRGTPAGLTVSATLFAAHLAGICVFATGGIGGVHLPFEIGDISADLVQLSRAPVITVCSGAKSVLDVPRTLEFLETVGVPVYAYGTVFFPAFYLLSSGISVPRVDTPDEVAHIARAQWNLGHMAGIVIGNPIPDAWTLDEEEWSTWLEAARSDAESEGIRGKDVTPFLLDHVARSSGGRTVAANLALLESNASLASRIACALGQ